MGNIIKLRNKPSSEMSPVLFFEKILQKDLTKREKCAVDLLTSVNKSTLVNRK